MVKQSFPRKPITDVFTQEDACIDRRLCQRIVPMKVLVLGLGRTGTASVREALKQLGYVDTYHMMSASVENPLDCLLWQQAFEAKYDGVGTFGKAEWDQLLGHCQAVCDWPAIAFSRELIKAYPDAKVILQSRNVDSWHNSVMKTVYWRVTEPKLRIASYVDWGAGLYYPMLKKFFNTFFEGNFPDCGKDVFARHYKEVRTLVPTERLLEYRVSEGWSPLCDFLGESKPFGPFPFSNDAEAFVTRCNWRTTRQLCNAGFRYLVLGVILGFLYILSGYLYSSL